MDLPADPAICANFRGWSRILVRGTLLLAASVFLGWLAHLPMLTHWVDGLEPMKANTSLCFLLLALGAERRLRWLAFPALLVAVPSLWEELFQVNLGIDQLWVVDTVSSDGRAGRMSGATASILILLSIGLLYPPRPKRFPIHQVALLLVLLFSALFMLGYLYEASAIYKASKYASTSFLSGVCGIGLATALLLAYPESGFMALMSSNSLGGTACRRILPPLLLAPTLIGYLRLMGQREGYYGTEFGLAIMALGNTIVLAGGTLIQFAYLGRSENQRNQLQQDLAEQAGRTRSEARLRALYSSLQEAIITLDVGGKVTEFNASAQRFFGYSLQQASGIPFLNLVAPCDRAAIQTELERIQREYISQRLNLDEMQPDGAREVRAMRRDGTQFPCELSLSTWKAGEHFFVTAVLRDISQRKLIQLNQIRTAQIIDASEDGIGWGGSDGQLSYLNPAARRMLGIKPEQNVQALNVLHFYHNRLHEKFLQEILPASRRQGQWSGMTHLKASRGREFPVSLTCMALRSEDGSEFLTLIFRDISQQEERERDLAIASDRAQVANRAKSEFLANMSHELRTPLNAIIGFSQILVAQSFGDLNPKQTRYSQNIHSSGRHLLSLINDILDISKIEAGKMELSKEPLDIAHILEISLEVTHALAQTKLIAVAKNLQAEAPLIQADPLRLQQIFVNLISNAIKYTPDGGRLDIHSQVLENFITIRFIDTGIGIKREDQQRIFQKFEQADNSYARAQEGTGLGLALTRDLVRLHGGDIALFSAGENTGCTFTVSLPIN